MANDKTKEAIKAIREFRRASVALSQSDNDIIIVEFQTAAATLFRLITGKALNQQQLDRISSNR